MAGDIRSACARRPDALGERVAQRRDVALVNATLAATFWPGENAVGRRFRVADEPSNPWLTVIGVVPDIRTVKLDESRATPPTAYMPHRHMSTRNYGIIVRTQTHPVSIVPAVEPPCTRVDRRWRCSTSIRWSGPLAKLLEVVLLGHALRRVRAIRWSLSPRSVLLGGRLYTVAQPARGRSACGWRWARERAQGHHQSMLPTDRPACGDGLQGDRADRRPCGHVPPSSRSAHWRLAIRSAIRAADLTVLLLLLGRPISRDRSLRVAYSGLAR